MAALLKAIHHMLGSFQSWIGIHTFGSAQVALDHIFNACLNFLRLRECHIFMFCHVQYVKSLGF